MGLAVAREALERRPGARVEVLEAADRIAPLQSSHNSGVVHAGIYYAPGSLKARLAVAGNRALYEYCEARGIAHRRCGKLIVATRPSQLAGLDELERRGRANGVPGLRRLRAEEMADVEPHVRGVAALHSPQTGVVDFAAVAAALAADVRAAGGTIRLDHRVDQVARPPDPRRMVVCAGVASDALAPRGDVRVLPFRGAYRTLRRPELVRALVYPVPDPDLPFLGVHLTRGVDDEVHVGPTALLLPRAHALSWPGTWRMARRWWRTGATELHHAVRPRALAAAAAEFVPAIEPGDLGPGFAGVRAQAVRRDGALLDDFLLETAGSVTHVRNAPSPAATACLALASEILDAVRF